MRILHKWQWNLGSFTTGCCKIVNSTLILGTKSRKAVNLFRKGVNFFGNQVNLFRTQS